MRILGITQARIGSTRLPKKILLKIEDKTLLEYHLERALQSKKVTDWVVATTDEPDSNLITDIAQKNGIRYFKGDVNNVLDRFYQSTKLFPKPDYVLRITSDCPLVDASLIDQVIEFTINNKLHYCRTSDGFPDGVDVEVFAFSALENAFKQATLPSDKEHVTPFIRRNYEKEKGLFTCEEDFNHIRLTVDELADFETINLLISRLGSNLPWIDYVKFIIQHPTLFSNQKIIRNEGYLKSLSKDDQ